MPSKNVHARIRQHRAAAIGEPSFPGSFVAGKIRNSRTKLRRHGGPPAARAVAQLAELARSAERETQLESLLGLEGTAARVYFEQFGDLLASPSSLGAIRFEERNRRPPRDPVNALLSVLYALLIKDATVALLAAGLDPYVGFYHRPRFGRPALALDLAEKFRPFVADSTVLTVVNNGEVRRGDFVERAGAVALTQRGRKQSSVPTSDDGNRTQAPSIRYRASYRRSLELQARLVAAVLTGDVPAYRSLTTR